MITDPNDPLYYIYAGLKVASDKLVTGEAFAQASMVVMAYQRDAIAALIAGTPVAAQTPEQVTAHIHLASVEAMATQFQTHLEFLEAAASKDRNFWRADRWFDPTPPLAADPGPLPPDPDES